MGGLVNVHDAAVDDRQQVGNLDRIARQKRGEQGFGIGRGAGGGAAIFCQCGDVITPGLQPRTFVQWCQRAVGNVIDRPAKAIETIHRLPAFGRHHPHRPVEGTFARRLAVGNAFKARRVVQLTHAAIPRIRPAVIARRRARPLKWTGAASGSVRASRRLWASAMAMVIAA